MYSWVMKYSPPTTPKSNTGTMFECTRPGLHARLVDELRDRLLVARQLGAQALEHEVAREPLDARRLGDEELGHPALAQPVEQPVAPERGADADRRRRVARDRPGWRAGPRAGRGC